MNSIDCHARRRPRGDAEGRDAAVRAAAAVVGAARCSASCIAFFRCRSVRAQHPRRRLSVRRRRDGLEHHRRLRRAVLARRTGSSSRSAPIWPRNLFLDAQISAVARPHSRRGARGRSSRPLISWPTFRLRGPFFAIATMAFNEVALRPRELFRAPHRRPSRALRPVPRRPREHDLPRSVVLCAADARLPRRLPDRLDRRLPQPPRLLPAGRPRQRGSGARLRHRRTLHRSSPAWR